MTPSIVLSILVIILSAITISFQYSDNKKRNIFKQLKEKYEGKNVTFTGFGWVIFKIVELRKNNEDDMEILVYNKEADEHMVLIFDEKNIKIKE